MRGILKKRSIGLLCLVPAVILALLCSPVPGTKASVGSVYGEYTVTHTSNGVQDLTINTSGGVYEITGNGAGAIIVNNASCVLILTGITRTQSRSRLQIIGTSDVTLYLAENTVNTFKSTGTNTTMNEVQAGIYVDPSAALTIEGPGKLYAEGGVFGAGIGGIRTAAASYSANPPGLTNPSGPSQASGTITIESGTVEAVSGFGAAGIGGGWFGKGGKTTINGGNVTAISAAKPTPNGYTSNYGGAGIGGGGCYPSNGNMANSSGEIAINGGVVTARAERCGTGIGGGRDGYADKITINGGTVYAEGTDGGSGIGGGWSSICGTVDITGGHITARSDDLAAGIGNGHGKIGGTITISGGIVDAQSGDPMTSGVGGGINSTATVILTGGNVLSLTSEGMIRVNTNPTNGPAYGNARVYMVAVDLKDELNNILPDSDVSINVTNGSGTLLYTYSAKTDEHGMAYMWLPNGNYEYLLYNPDNGAYSDGTTTVSVPTNTEQYPPGTNIFPMQIASTHPQWDFMAIPQGDNISLALAIAHTNAGTHPSKSIAGVKWYRENVANPVNTQETFDAGYAAAAAGNYGEGGVGNALDLTVLAPDTHGYAMSIDNNGRYWIQIHYKGANTGKDVYHVAHLDVVSFGSGGHKFTCEKNAYINGSATATNGADDAYQPVRLNDTILYEIKLNSQGSRLPSKVFNPVFQPKEQKPEKVNFINGSFEEPVIGGSIPSANGKNDYYSYFWQADVPGWSTRPTYQTSDPYAYCIELQKPRGTSSFAWYAPDGNQYAELNANVEGTLYQVCDTVPGTKVYYEFYHGAQAFRAGLNTDVMNFYLRKEGETTGGLQEVCSDSAIGPVTANSNYQWGHYTGSYVVPAGQTRTEFSFESVSTTSGMPDYGNYLDAIRLYTSSYMDLTVSNNAAGGKAKAGELVTYTIVAENKGESDASHVTVSMKLPAGTDLVPDTVEIDGVPTVNYSYNPGARELSVNIGAEATDSAGGFVKGYGSFSTDCESIYEITFQVEVNGREIAENLKYETQVKAVYEDRYDTDVPPTQYWNYSAPDAFDFDQRYEAAVTDVLPTGLTYVSHSNAGGSAFNRTGRTCTWTWEDLPAGETAVTVTAKVESDTEVDLINRATVDVRAISYATNYTYHALWLFFDVTVTKTVTGDFGDETKAFNFTATFADSTGKALGDDVVFDTTGGPLPLDEHGKAEFTLTHGQSITIEKVRSNGKIRIEEAEDPEYSPSFEDSEGPAGNSGDTGMRDMTLSDRTFDFTNAGKAVGINVTIAKTVRGEYGDKTRAFPFTVFFMDSSKEPLPAGTTFKSSLGTFTLEEGGQVSFPLSHDQSITIERLRSDGWIRIAEEEDDYYDAYFVDEKDHIEHPGSVGQWNLTPENRSFRFINERKVVAETGIMAGDTGTMLLFPILIAAAIFLHIAVTKACRRRGRGGALR